MKVILGSMTFSDQVSQADAATMIDAFCSAGHNELDSAYMYCGGATENLLGELNKSDGLRSCAIATKINPLEGGLTPESVDHQLTTSLKRMGVDSVDMIYLHQPDLNTPISETLQALDRHHQAGRFKRFGLSNYASWQVAEIAGICEQRGYLMPSVYQGMYNAITRDVERELFLCLHNYDIAFYVYNPLAGGLLTGKHFDVSQLPEEGRFSAKAEYRSRYWKNSYFDAVNTFKQSCEQSDIAPANAALRWLKHHSGLVQEKGDGVILGASTIGHFEDNLDALTQGPLPATVTTALDDAWDISRPECIKYFRP